MSAAQPPSADECWVWLPRDREGALRPEAAAELLYEASALSRRLGLALICWSDRALASSELRDLAAWGVRRVRQLERPLDPHPICLNARLPLPAGVVPRVFLFAGDSTGRVLAPLWAAVTGATFIPDVTSLTSDGARFVAARAALGGEHEALVTVEQDRALVASLVPGSVGAAAPPRSTPHSPAPAPGLSTVVTARAGPVGNRILPPDPATLDVADAERIVAFGRGAFAPEAIELVRELAGLLGAVVAGSRPAADEGWIPFARQIGLTGAIVRPKLYVAVGISGAPYHMAGIKDPETLIAINRDPEAPILGAANLAIVGDLYQVLPELIAQLKRGQAPGPLQSAAAAAGVRE